IQSGETTQVLAPLPIAALRIEAELDILRELGIDRVGQLMTIPREALAARFGEHLFRRLDQATGATAEPVISHLPAPNIIVETSLEISIEYRQAIDLILAQLIERLVKTLVERQQGVIQLE